jgi:hypothetical protein
MTRRRRQQQQQMVSLSMLAAGLGVRMLVVLVGVARSWG